MTETTEQLPLGVQLKNAREALNLTVEDVAQKTNLKKNHIEAIENDVFILSNVPPAFVRGYVRNYVRFLRLPEELVSKANYGEVTIPKEVKKAAPLKVTNNQKSQNRWVKILTWVILLSAVGMTLAWWWQEHQKDEMSRAEIVGTTEVAQATAPVVQAVENTTQNTNSAPLTTVVEPAPVQATPAENPQPAAAEITPALTAPTETTEGTTAQPTETAMAEQPATTETQTAEQQAATNAELRIEIAGGQSWITVRSPKAKRSLAEKLYNDGEVLTFNDNEQYRLTIGAPANVKIYYKGQQIPLKVDGRVARIKLPQ